MEPRGSPVRFRLENGMGRNTHWLYHRWIRGCAYPGRGVGKYLLDRCARRSAGLVDRARECSNSTVCCGYDFHRLDGQHSHRYGAERQWRVVCRHHAVSYTHLRAHETKANLVCRLLLEKKKDNIK